MDSKSEKGSVELTRLLYELSISFVGGQTSFTIGFKNRREYGYSYVPVVFIFEEKNGSKFHILRFLAVHIVSDLHDALKPTAPYKAPRRAFKVPLDVKTTPGLKLPP